jgi:rapamycin-insensitive companion of mTOR
MLAKFQAKLGLAKNAIVTMLKSWVGLICIGNDPSVISSLLETLKEIPKKYDSEVRKAIFETLEEIVAVGDNVLTASTA